MANIEIKNTPSPHNTAYRSRRGLVGVIILSVIIILMIAGFVSSLMLGVITVRSNHFAVFSNKCHAVIDQYNQAIGLLNTQGAANDMTTYTQKQKTELTDVLNKINATSGHDNDANCVQMKLGIAQNIGTAKQAKVEAQKLADLAKSGYYATSEISGVTSLDQIDAILKTPDAGPVLEGKG